MKEAKSVPQQHHQNGHLSPFKFAKLLDPEASWDKVRLSLLSLQSCPVFMFFDLFEVVFSGNRLY